KEVFHEPFLFAFSDRPGNPRCDRVRGVPAVCRGRPAGSRGTTAPKTQAETLWLPQETTTGVGPHRAPGTLIEMQVTKCALGRPATVPRPGRLWLRKSGPRGPAPTSRGTRLGPRPPRASPVRSRAGHRATRPSRLSR